MNSNSDDDSCSSDDSDLAFANMDFGGVSFGGEEEDGETVKEAPIIKEPAAQEKNIPSDSNIKEAKVISNIKNTTVASNEALEDGIQSLTSGHEVGKVTPSQKLSADLETISIDKVNVEIAGSELDEESKLAIGEERKILLKDCYWNDSEMNVEEGSSGYESVDRIRDMAKHLSRGHYIDILNGPSAKSLFDHDDVEMNSEYKLTVSQRIRHCVLKYCTSVSKCVEAELIGVAALNLFMQPNYTGPSLHHGGVSRPGKEEETYEELRTINPHPLFTAQLKVSGDVEVKEETTKEGDEHHEPPIDVPFHNAVLAELSVDGEWPCPVCKYPYFLLLARSILSTIAIPNRPSWTQNIVHESYNKISVRKSRDGNFFESPQATFVAHSQQLFCVTIWCGRAVVAHCRLIQSDEPSMTLWKEAKCIFDKCVSLYCENVEQTSSKEQKMLASKVMLEYGLAEHHFDIGKKGKPYFVKALSLSDLDVEVTGSEGRRTKYQEKATAQMLVKAKPTKENTSSSGEETSEEKETVRKQEVKFNEDTILLEKVNYVEDSDNIHYELTIHQQTVLLALCLDVKNDNPMDGLTGEQMGAYLERLLQQHDDWMVYATGLLERAWLQSEGNHTRERALLQLQALADQHTNRLTLTQSTFQAAIEDSAPPSERLRNIHYIVYPPRWGALADLAERYARIGIVTSAAEIYEEIELWDEVVECYRRAGKDKKAEEVVRKRLSETETPRMWAALGGITGDISYYEKSLELSDGKFSSAYVALGEHYMDKGDLAKAVEYYKTAVQIKPLSPQVWFRLGALSMRLLDWGTALQAFTEVVQQEPEEGDAWGNVAAIHMHNKNPAEAYPALNESLKLNRQNWRVWVSKLYTCMDLEKYDEAVQACMTLIDFKSKRNASEEIPHIEEKVARALVGSSLKRYGAASSSGDIATLDSAKRTLIRLRELLTKMQETMKEAWVHEICAHFNGCVGRIGQAVDDLMKEYRALTSYKGWESDSSMIKKICRVISQILELHLEGENVDALKKFKFLIKGVISKINAAHFNPERLPKADLKHLEEMLTEIETKLE